MRHPRNAFIMTGAATAFATICMPRYAKAAEFTYKLSVPTPPGVPETIYALEAASKTLHDSNGRLEVQVYPNSQLGTEASLISQVRFGALELNMSANITIAAVVPSAGIDGLPFIYPTLEDGWRAMDGALGTFIRADIEKAGMHAFAGVWDDGFRQIANTVRPIHVPDDIKGLKIRVVPSPITTEVMRALGASATPIPYAELYTSIQTHLVDGSELGWGTVEAGKFYEICKYVSQTNHAHTGMTVLASVTAMQRLPKNLRDILEDNLNAASRRERVNVKEQASTFIAQLKSQGMLYNSTDFQAFRQVIQKAGLFTRWRTTFPEAAWKALEQSAGTLG